MRNHTNLAAPPSVAAAITVALFSIYFFAGCESAPREFGSVTVPTAPAPMKKTLSIVAPETIRVGESITVTAVLRTVGRAKVKTPKDVTWGPIDSRVARVTTGNPLRVEARAPGDFVLQATLGRTVSNAVAVSVVAESGSGVAKKGPALGIDAEGWTVLPASADSRTIYVSSSSGEDTNTGASPQSPLKTLRVAVSQLRHTCPDWLLLKRGDTWEETLTGFNKSGRSEMEPMVIGSYGDKEALRPRIDSPEDFLVLYGRTPVRHIAFVGLRIHAPGHAGIKVGRGSGDILIEDCYFGDSLRGIQIQNDPPAVKVRVRRNVIVDCHIGIFGRDAVDLLIEENYIDKNGVSKSHDHNIYLSQNTTRTVVRNNFVTRASNLGLKFRGPHVDGRVEGNVFSGNQNGLAVNCKTEGQQNQGTRILDNVFVETGHSDHHGAIYYGATKDGVIRGNIVANTTFTAGRAIKFNHAQYFSKNPSGDWPGIQGLLFEHNTIYNWHGTLVWFADEGGIDLDYTGVKITDNLFFLPRTGGSKYIIDHAQTPKPDTEYRGNVYFAEESRNSWFRVGGSGLSQGDWRQVSKDQESKVGQVELIDPRRTLGTYHESLGRPASLQAVIDACRAQRRGTWRKEYEIPAMRDYIRAGFRPKKPLGSNRPGAMPR